MLKLIAGPSLRHWGGTALMAVAGLALAAAPAEAQADGAKVYATVCASCHMATGEGVTGIFPPLTESQWVTGDEAVLAKIILHGVTGEIEVGGEIYSGMMPPWGGNLDDAEIAAVATYLRSNFGNDAGPVSVDLVKRVRAEHASRKTPWTAQELLAAPETQK